MDGEKLKGTRILVAEDDNIGATIIKRFFELWGILYDLAENGEEILIKAAENEYDLLLMDVQLPGITGLEATIRIRNGNDLNKDKPIIGLSAHAAEWEAQKCLDAGMNDYISKPFDPSHLFGTILFHVRK